MNQEILIVDDEPRITKSFTVLFKNQGIGTLTASNGIEAIDTLKKLSVKVILSDIQMPKMNGFDLLKKTKEIDPCIQFIFLTGYANIENTKKAFKDDAFEFFKKPIEDYNVLFKAIKKAVLRYNQLKKEQDAKQKKVNSFSAVTTIFDSLDAVVYVSDIDTYELIYTNKQFNRELGYPEDKVFIGYKCWEIIQTGQTGPCSFCTNSRILSGNGDAAEPYEWEFYNENTQKHYRIVDKAIEWFDGRIVRLETAYNISDRKKYEKLSKKFEKTNQTLKKLESLGTLSGGIAHRFNNALSVITGNLNLIKMDYQKEKRLNLYTKQITDSAHRMTQLTSSLLAYARGGKYQAQTFQISDYLIKKITKFRQDLPPMLTMIADIYAKDCCIKADKNQLEMLIFSVLENAVEATQEIGTITVLCEKENPGRTDFQKINIAPDKEYVLLRIVDDGSGMEDEIRERIFDPFFTTKFEGRGLGLSAAYGIVKNHDGYIFIDSKPGKGTTVKIYLPIVQNSSITVKIGNMTSSVKDITVLLVEDDEAVMDVTKMMLTRKGYKVLLASTGKEAVELASSNHGKINIALLDFILPDMNGDIIYPLIQKYHPEMKVIILSGYALSDPIQKLLETGAKAFLQKPVTMAELSEKIEEIS